MNNISASVDQDEIDKFSAIAEEWWNPSGKFKPLHAINSVRIKYLVDTIKEHIVTQGKSLEDISILDIGCGGGLLSEPFARLGCKVTAIDASEKNINIAKLHSSNMMLNIDYQNTTVEELAKTQNTWDVILNMEVIEHVDNIDSFISSSAELMKESGLMFISTINKNVKSFLLAIIAAEYILKWLPIGTHNYKKFLKPSEIANYLRKNNLNLTKIKGISYNLFDKSWQISNDISVNYILTTRK